MPSTKNYRTLHEQVVARPGAAERLLALRDETLAEIGLNELRAAFQRSQAELAAELGVTQSAVSQLERGGDVKISTLRNYLRGLGADLQIIAVFTQGDDETVVPLRIGPTGE
jgi:DNA-binding XRE family transcriptional regulator